MLDRANVLMILYDFPVKEGRYEKQAEKFRKQLKRNGFIRLQKSIYVKLIKNGQNAEGEIRKLNDVIPDKGDLKSIEISLSNFKRMNTIMGNDFDMSIFSDELIIV